MPLTIGPSAWWLKTRESINYYAKLCPVGTTLPDGSITICKNGVQAWIVAPANTQVSMAWIGGQYPGDCVTTAYPGRNFSLVCEWSTLQSCLVTRGFNPSDWFVPSCAQLLTPGYSCRGQWSPSSTRYWSSTEFSATDAYGLDFNFGNAPNFGKTGPCCVRAFRCVTY